MGQHDVFISYSRDDRPKVEKIAQALGQKGLRVWWDPEIKTGAGFRQEISEALSSSRSVLVIWSRNSVGSRFVCDEADEGAARDILFPALFDNVNIPLGFRQIQTADLTHWRGNLNDPALKAFVGTVVQGASRARGAPPRERKPDPTPAPTAKKTKPMKKQKPPKPPKQQRQKSAYTTTGSKRRIALYGQAVLMAAIIAAAFAALAYSSDFVFAAYRPFFVGAMGVLAFLSRYGTLEADRAAGAASLALLPRSYMALILFSLIAISPLVLEGRLYAAALEGVQVKGIEGADINNVTLASDGSKLLTSSDDNTVKVWDAQTGVELGEFTEHDKGCSVDENKCWVWGADFSPDGKLAVSASRDLTADIWQISNMKLVRQLKGHTSTVRAAVWAPDGTAIATASHDNTIIIWDPESGEAIRTLRGHTDRVHALHFSPNGDLLASASRDGNVRLWNWRTGARVSALSIGGEGNDVKFSNDGSMFAAAAENGRIRIWNTASRERLATFNHGAEKAFSIAFANDDKTLATSGIDPVIRLWNIADQTLIIELEGHKDGVRSLDSPNDGSIIVSGSRDNTARIWDAKTGKELVTMGHIKSAIDLPMAIDTPPVFISSQAPVPVDFKKHPETGAYLLGKGVVIAFALLIGALIVKGVLWIAGARSIARLVVVTVLFAVTAYLGLLTASALPGEALALWLTIAFIPATVFAMLRWVWRRTILRNVTGRRSKV
ncbi:MAG: TIR domain-containing protein [Marinicaulis sp.]|nr:TIR domain-containing protein [Marinicaulis sp.]